MDDGPEYLFDVETKPSLPWHDVPLIRATDASVRGYGVLVDDPGHEVEITRWPAQGWRPVDPGTGDEAGSVEGTFTGTWDGDVLFGRNEAVGGHYVLGFSKDPADVARGHDEAPERVLLWHMNYHPDGGQLFFPLDARPFVVPVALPGDDITPGKIVGLWLDGTKGLSIHADIWHDGIYPVSGTQRFLTRQGRVHARVSADFGSEFGVYLSVPLTDTAPD